MKVIKNNNNFFSLGQNNSNLVKTLEIIIDKTTTFKNLNFVLDYLETSLLRGSIKTIKTELEKNDAFLIAFRDFSQEFSYFKKDSYRLKEFEKTLKEENSLISERESQNIIEKIKNSSILGFFIEFKKRSESNHIISNKTIIDFSKNKNFERLVKPKTIIKITTPFMILDGEPKSGVFDSKIKTIEPYFQGKKYNEKN